MNCLFRVHSQTDIDSSLSLALFPLSLTFPEFTLAPNWLLPTRNNVRIIAAERTMFNSRVAFDARVVVKSIMNVILSDRRAKEEMMLKRVAAISEESEFSLRIC